MLLNLIELETTETLSINKKFFIPGASILSQGIEEEIQQRNREIENERKREREREK